MTRDTEAARHRKARRHADNDAAIRMGFLVHELRNALACVFVAQAMIKKAPGESGAEALLERNLQHMRVLLDRADTEIRFHKEPPAHLQPLPLAEAVAEVAGTAAEQARIKGVSLRVDVDPNLTVSADGPYLASALANLVRNAIKFTSPGGTVLVRGLEKGHAALVEVEDQCGGLPGGRTEELFEPFTQKGSDRSGLGLGLAISRRAVELNAGTLAVRNIPGKGCVFTISLPRARARRGACHEAVTNA